LCVEIEICCPTCRIMIGLEFDKVGPYGAFMGCWVQDYKSARRGRKIIISFLSQAYQEACERCPVTKQQIPQDQNSSMEVVRATSQDKLVRLPGTQLQELCQQLGLKYAAPRGNAARLLKRHVAELNENHQAEEGEQALDGVEIVRSCSRRN